MDINEQYHVQNEWDQIAQIRFEDLENRIDKSYEMILKPSILNNFVCQNKLDNFSSSMKLINTSNGVL